MPRTVARRLPERLTAADAITAVLLAAATAAVVVWQNSRLTVLWDLSYILENATRIAAGDVPYRDFPFPYAPLTFVGQAVIIRLFGRSIVHHIIYAATAGAAATAVTYCIVRLFGNGRTVALLLCVPLTILGIYCIYPHPFYDPDACLAVLIVLLLFLTTRSTAGRFATGAAAVVPLLVKQNIGLAFLGGAVLVFLLLREKAALAGVAAAAAAAVTAIAASAGLQNYVHWTIGFAASRRLPPLSQQLSIYDDQTLWWWLAAVGIGALLALRWPLAGTLIATAPWLWTVYDWFATDDPNEPEINFLLAWPLLIVCAAVAAVLLWRRDSRRSSAVLLALAAIHGAFMSQSTWGSTYGIWPLFVLLVAFAIVSISRANLAAAVIASAIIAATTLLEAVPYVAGNNRLTYAKVGDGTLARGQLPQLQGLSMRGPWIADFEQLVAWSEKNIPRDDAILSLPGEDLFYFTTKRRPRVPVLMFDRTVNPYDAGQLAAIAQQRQVRWVIVKRRLQINGTPMEQLPELLRLLRPRLTPATRLRNYDVYQLR